MAHIPGACLTRRILLPASGAPRPDVERAARLYSHIASAEGPPDIVHAHGSQWAGAVAARLYERYGIPFVLTEHMSNFARGRISEEDTDYLRGAFDVCSVSRRANWRSADCQSIAAVSRSAGWEAKTLSAVALHSPGLAGRESIISAALPASGAKCMTSFSMKSR